MRRFKRAILGASCRAAGELLKGPDGSLIIERADSIGSEYFNSYRRCEGWWMAPASETVKRFQKEMAARGMLSGEGDCYGLAPLVYERLKGLEGCFMLGTEILGVKASGGGFELELWNRSGRERIDCEELVDNTLYCVSDRAWGRANIKSKRINAAVWTDDAEKALNCRLEGAELRPGRDGKELFLSCPLAPETSWAEARAKLLSLWQSRGEGLKAAKIEAIAKEFDCSFKEDEHRFDDGRLFLNCVKFPNPLEALDCGLSSSNSAR